jgi:hypothetical protein
MNEADPKVNPFNGSNVKLHAQRRQVWQKAKSAAAKLTLSVEAYGMLPVLRQKLKEEVAHYTWIFNNRKRYVLEYRMGLLLEALDKLPDLSTVPAGENDPVLVETSLSVSPNAVVRMAVNAVEI